MTDLPSRGPRFALIGAAGFVARRHLEAMRSVGGTLVAAHDLHDSVGLLDGYFPLAEFFVDPAEFTDYIACHQVDYLSVCTPSDLHEAHCELATTADARVIVEKPPALSTAGIDRLARLEARTGLAIYPVLQLRYHADLIRFREQIAAGRYGASPHVVANYVARRGPWYAKSWKGDSNRSGTIIFTFGIHLFDILVWVFGPHRRVSACLSDDGTRASGSVEFANATVEWLLSSRGEDLPAGCQESASRQFLVNGTVAADYSGPYAGLHRAVYQEIVHGKAPRIADARTPTELACSVRQRLRLVG
ncbi:MAG TPA: Gfo/Idh/MocA family oxidoreductase [Streptosporangiaceae bacterium]|nr:Gfo/Idh/MocA family oxidoreductase [Streptosporangiaceae bacterium]